MRSNSLRKVFRGMDRNSKFGSKKEVIDGYKFLSLLEAKRYGELKLLERAGEIKNLEVHPRYPLVVKGHPICTYEADFRYEDVRRGTIVEDTKGVRTALFSIKKKLMRAVHGIDVQEIRA